MSDQFADLSWKAAEELLGSPRRPVLLLPLGALEAHGPHAPLGTDLLISLGICRRAAEQLRDHTEVRVLVLPPIPYGVTRCAASFTGTVGISGQTLHALLLEVCSDLIRQGFRWLVVVNNHFEPEHVWRVHAALDEVEARTGVVVGYLDLTRRHRAERLGDEFRSGSCHGGRYETSLVLADRPDLVDSTLLRRLPPKPVDLVRGLSSGARDFRELGMEQAYCGWPADATPEEGRATFEVLTDLLVQTILEVVRGGGRDRPGRLGTKP
ncbi:MAG: creatininase family protein [Armatimonadota bacterium]|nr:creatininase family protein [Armatimonadota bacterium]MDW8156989.1 creatininase family protein [Armatimonadota bacterium]